jgi:fluoroacetyl-CoA thioesterase
MKAIFKVGNTKEYRKIVQPADTAAFHGENVHPVYSTFSLARDIEWTTRLFVLEMRDADEEGIGTYLTIEHKAPAFIGEEILITGKIEQLRGSELICSFQAQVGDKIIAIGQTGQKILKLERFNDLFKQSKPQSS